MTPPDPARIAAGLTEDMRDVLLRFVDGERNDMLSYGELAAISDLYRVDPEAVWQLMSRPASDRPHRLVLTDLGRAVRAALADSRAATPAAPETDMGDLATRIAAQIKERWAVGDFSRFCDEPADFDSATTEELADLIRGMLTAEPPAIP